MIRLFSRYVSPKNLLLIWLEGALVACSLLAGVKLYHWYLQPHPMDVWPHMAAQAFLIMVTFQTCFYYNDLYGTNGARRGREQILRLCESLGVGCLFLLGVSYLVPALRLALGAFFLTVVLAGASVVLLRLALDSVWPASAWRQNILVLGTGELAVTVARELAHRDDLNIRLVGLVGGRAEEANGGAVGGFPIAGHAEDLEAVAQQHRVARIVVAVEDRRGGLPVDRLVRLRVRGVRIEDAHSVLAALTGRVFLNTIRPSWFVFAEGFHRSGVRAAVKRVVDLTFGLIGLVLGAPLMALIAAAIRLDSKGPILYRQTRVGLGGRHFELLKFRSMRPDAEQEGVARWAAEDDPRVTRVGRFLRHYRLDELPQLVNVVRGEMSFVGPRPQRPEFVELLRQRTPYYDERHSVRPGVTGWAQVCYGYAASVEDELQKLEYDLFYLKNMSLRFDCAIVLQTARIVLLGRGVR